MVVIEVGEERLGFRAEPTGGTLPQDQEPLESGVDRGGDIGFEGGEELGGRERCSVYVAEPRVLGLEPLIEAAGHPLAGDAEVQPGFRQEEPAATDSEGFGQGRADVFEVVGDVAHRHPFEAPVGEREFFGAGHRHRQTVRSHVGDLARVGFDAVGFDARGSAPAQDRAPPAADVEHRAGRQRLQGLEESLDQAIGDRAVAGVAYSQGRSSRSPLGLGGRAINTHLVPSAEPAPTGGSALTDSWRLVLSMP